MLCLQYVEKYQFHALTWSQQGVYIEHFLWIVTHTSWQILEISCKTTTYMSVLISVSARQSSV